MKTPIEDALAKQKIIHDEPQAGIASKFGRVWTWPRRAFMNGKLPAKATSENARGTSRNAKTNTRETSATYWPGRPWRKGNPNGFRVIHTKLAEAVRFGKLITLRVLGNCPLERLTERENELIAERGALNVAGRS